MPQTTTIRLPDDLYEHYRKQAFDQRTSMNALIVSALYADETFTPWTPATNA